MPKTIPKIPSIKKVKQFAKDPRTYWKIFNQLFPLGVGGLRPPSEKLPWEYNVPYQYHQFDLVQNPAPFAYGGGSGQLTGYPEAVDKPRPPGQKQKEKTGHPQPPYEAPYQPPEIPRPDDLVEDVPPVHPVEESDEAEDEGEPKETRIPRRRPPEYEAWPMCSDLPEYNLLGIPRCTTGGAKISIQTAKTTPLRKYGQKSKTYRKGRYRYYPR